MRPAGPSPSSAVDRDAEGKGARFAERLRANELSEPGAGRFDEAAARPAEEPRARGPEPEERAPETGERRGEETSRAETDRSDGSSSADASGEGPDEASPTQEHQGADAGLESETQQENDSDAEGGSPEAALTEEHTGDEPAPVPTEAAIQPADVDGSATRTLPAPAPVVAAAPALAAIAKEPASATALAAQSGTEGAAGSQAITAVGDSQAGTGGPSRDSDPRAGSGAGPFADAFDSLSSADAAGIETRSAFAVSDLPAALGAETAAPPAVTSLAQAVPAVQLPAASAPPPAAPLSGAPGEFIEARLADVERAAAILDQVRVHLRPGMREATLSLEPESLGRLRVSVKVHEGKLTAELRVERPEAFAALEKHIPELRAALADSGIETERLDVKLGFEHREASAGRDGASRQRGSRAGREGGEAQDLPAWSPSALRNRLARRITDRGVDTYA